MVNKGVAGGKFITSRDRRAPKQRRHMTSPEIPYFAHKSRQCKESADLMLVLDGDERLLVHSVYLIAQSDVLSDIIETASAEETDQRHKFRCKELPLPDTTKTEACNFLVALYEFHGTTP